jgi:hypothetical protein
MFPITDQYPYWPLSKILEKVIYNRLLEHLINNNILVKEQFWFRKNLKTEKATYELC